MPKGYNSSLFSQIDNFDNYFFSGLEYILSAQSILQKHHKKLVDNSSISSDIFSTVLDTIRMALNDFNIFRKFKKIKRRKNKEGSKDTNPPSSKKQNSQLFQAKRLYEDYKTNLNLLRSKNKELKYKAGSIMETMTGESSVGPKSHISNDLRESGLFEIPSGNVRRNYSKNDFFKKANTPSVILKSAGKLKGDRFELQNLKILDSFNGKSILDRTRTKKASGLSSKSTRPISNPAKQSQQIQVQGGPELFLASYAENNIPLFPQKNSNRYYPTSVRNARPRPLTHNNIADLLSSPQFQTMPQVGDASLSKLDQEIAALSSQICSEYSQILK